MTETLTPSKRFWLLLKPDAREIKNIYIYSIFNGLVGLSLPLGIQTIVNFIQSGQISTSWIVMVVVVVAGIAVTGVLQIFQMRITENLQQKIFTRAAFEFAYRIPRIRMEELYKHYAPELMNRFFDTISVQKGLSKILIDFSSAALQVIFGLILLSFYHPFFILFSLVLVLLVYSIIRFTSKRGLESSLEESKYKYKVAHWLEEIARTATTFKLAGITNLPLERTDHNVSKYLTAREKHFRILALQYSLLVGFKVLVATGLLAFGGILVMQQHMNIGQFIAAEIIILLFMNSVEKMVFSLENAYDILTSLEKIGQVTDLELENESGIDLQDECDSCGLEIEIKGLQFSYPDSQDIDLEIDHLLVKSGERILVTGQNGSGKTTFLNILAGLYKIKKGTLSYNGFPIGNLKLSSLRYTIGDSLSQEKVFEGTLLENITMGRPAATFENVKWTVKNLFLEDFVKSLPDGYETVLDPLGKKLPRSIVDKLLVARSIADIPRFLLLEDAFEHIDDEERNKILDFLMDRKNPWTLITVSSDQLVASKSDKIINMENGRIKSIVNN